MSLYEQMRERRAARKAELDALVAAAESRDIKDFTEDESAQFDALVAELRKDDDRLEELRKVEAADEAAKESRKQLADPGVKTGNAAVTDPPVYVEDGSNGKSYFRDLGNAVMRQDMAAMERLRRNTAMQAETRALGNTGAAGGSGGEFAPPAWLVNDWINLIRAGRITADLFPKQSVPVGVSSVNYPRILTGTTTAIQSTQNSALSQTDLATGSVQTGFATIGGKQVVSQQLLDQTAINFDQVILNDLAADYGLRVGTQIYLGTGTGSGTGAVVNGLIAATIGSTQTWTQASPTAAGFYGQAGALLSKFLTARLMPPTCWVMHPRRWYWLASAADSTGRPLVVPVGVAQNPIATQDNATAPAGMVGYFHGLPVYIDPLVPINIGAGTNQDNVYLLRTDDLVLFESPPQAEAFRETYADSVGVLFRMYGYVGTLLNRHTESLGVMSGTGLVTPTFAS
jgi:HK97 family phage major capsid protein